MGTPGSRTRHLSLGLAGAAMAACLAAAQQRDTSTPNVAVRRTEIATVDLGDHFDGMKGRRLIMSRFVIAPHAGGGEHSHKGRPEVLFVLKGSLAEYEGGRARVYEAGEAFASNTDLTQPHRIDNPDATTAEAIGVEIRGDVPMLSAVPGANWSVVANPADEGWSTEKLRAAQRYSTNIGSAAVMVVRNGRVIVQWGDVARRINVYSIRKSLLSALYGIYAAEGKIDANRMLGTLAFADFQTVLSETEKLTRIVDLLRARSGIYLPVDYENPQQKATRPTRGSYPPGTYWWYNNWDFNAAGTIFEHEAGISVGAALKSRIADRIGMQDFRPDDVFYVGGQTSPHRAYLMSLSARDLARFGQLYLNEGRWGDAQVVPADWVYKSTHTREMVQNEGRDAGGYEYLWWVAHEGVHLSGVKLPPGTFSARGAGGHYVMVIPSYGLVVVHRANNEPSARDIETINAAGGSGIKAADFARLLAMILAAGPFGDNAPVREG